MDSDGDGFASLAELRAWFSDADQIDPDANTDSISPRVLFPADSPPAVSVSAVPSVRHSLAYSKFPRERRLQQRAGLGGAGENESEGLRQALQAACTRAGHMPLVTAWAASNSTALQPLTRAGLRGLIRAELQLSPSVFSYAQIDGLYDLLDPFNKGSISLRAFALWLNGGSSTEANGASPQRDARLRSASLPTNTAEGSSPRHVMTLSPRSRERKLADELPVRGGEAVAAPASPPRTCSPPTRASSPPSLHSYSPVRVDVDAVAERLTAPRTRAEPRSKGATPSSKGAMSPQRLLPGPKFRPPVKDTILTPAEKRRREEKSKRQPASGGATDSGLAERLQFQAGSCVRSFAWPGSAPGQFSSPESVAVLGDRLFVTDTGNHRIQVLEADGTFLYAFGSQGVGNGQLKEPAGIAVCEKTRQVFVTDYSGNRVQVFSQDGVFVRAWGGKGANPGQFNKPCGIAVFNGPECANRVFVSDVLNHRIQEFTSEGKVVRSFGSFGCKPGEFNHPWGLAIAADQELLFVCDVNNVRVQVFTLDGVFLRSWGRPIVKTRIPSSPGQLYSPRSVALFAPSGSVPGQCFVADVSSQSVQVFDWEGNFLRCWHGAGAGEARKDFVKFKKPWSVATGPSQEVFVVDLLTPNNNAQPHIQVFR